MSTLRWAKGGGRGTGWGAAGQGLGWPCHKKGGRSGREAEGGSLSQQVQKGCAERPGKVRRKTLDLREEKRELQEVGPTGDAVGVGCVGVMCPLAVQGSHPTTECPVL